MDLEVQNTPPAERSDDLAEIIRAYHEVTEKLQHSHEKLKGEVLRLRRELASTNAQLQRSRRLSALGEMAAGIAHEIRNPLAAIQLYAGMAIDDLEAAAPQPEAAAGHAHKIAAAVRGLDGIVNDVLSFAREIEPNAQPVELPELLDQAVEHHRPAIDAAGVEVCRSDDPGDARGDAAGEALTIHADPALLHRAVLNLVRNAVEAMADRPRRVLTLGAAARRDDEEDGATIIVRDTGGGIDKANIDRIFNPFFTTRDTGTGLGLAIVHRIIDAHGGTIAVHNEVTGAGGAVFRLSLPPEPPAPAAAQRGGTPMDEFSVPSATGRASYASEVPTA